MVGEKDEEGGEKEEEDAGKEEEEDAGEDAEVGEEDDGGQHTASPSPASEGTQAKAPGVLWSGQHVLWSGHEYLEPSPHGTVRRRGRGREDTGASDTSVCACFPALPRSRVCVCGECGGIATAPASSYFDVSGSPPPPAVAMLAKNRRMCALACMSRVHLNGPTEHSVVSPGHACPSSAATHSVTLFPGFAPHDSHETVPLRNPGTGVVDLGMPLRTRHSAM